METRKIRTFRDVDSNWLKFRSLAKRKHRGHSYALRALIQLYLSTKGKILDENVQN